MKPLARICAFFCCFKARSLLYMGPNLFRPPRIRSARTAVGRSSLSGSTFPTVCHRSFPKKICLSHTRIYHSLSPIQWPSLPTGEIISLGLASQAFLHILVPSSPSPLPTHPRSPLPGTLFFFLRLLNTQSNAVTSRKSQDLPRQNLLSCLPPIPQAESSWVQVPSPGFDREMVKAKGP